MLIKWFDPLCSGTIDTSKIRKQLCHFMHKIKVEFLKKLTKQTQIFTKINLPHPPMFLMHLLASCRLKKYTFYLHYISNTLNASVIYVTDLRYHAYKLSYQLHDTYFCFYRVFFRYENPRENLNRIMRISNSRGLLKPPT